MKELEHQKILQQLQASRKEIDVLDSELQFLAEEIFGQLCGLETEIEQDTGYLTSLHARMQSIVYV